MTTYNSNLASEFYVLSMLYRLGIDASLTLGNKKAVDIIIAKDDGTLITIDVKGVAGKYDWPADNIHDFVKANQFYIFLSFEGRISDPQKIPAVWVMPAKEISRFIKKYSNRVDISRSKVNLNGQSFLNAWSLLINNNESK